jgi:hypothetical protein
VAQGGSNRRIVVGNQYSGRHANARTARDGRRCVFLISPPSFDALQSYPGGLKPENTGNPVPLSGIPRLPLRDLSERWLQV